MRCLSLIMDRKLLMLLRVSRYVQQETKVNSIFAQVRDHKNKPEHHAFNTIGLLHVAHLLTNYRTLCHPFPISVHFRIRTLSIGRLRPFLCRRDKLLMIQICKHERRRQYDTISHGPECSLRDDTVHLGAHDIAIHCASNQYPCFNHFVEIQKLRENNHHHIPQRQIPIMQIQKQLSDGLYPLNTARPNHSDTKQPAAPYPQCAATPRRPIRQCALYPLFEGRRCSRRRPRRYSLYVRGGLCSNSTTMQISSEHRI